MYSINRPPLPGKKIFVLLVKLKEESMINGYEFVMGVCNTFSCKGRYYSKYFIHSFIKRLLCGREHISSNHGAVATDVMPSKGLSQDWLERPGNRFIERLCKPRCSCFEYYLCVHV